MAGGPRVLDSVVTYQRSGSSGELIVAPPFLQERSYAPSSLLATKGILPLSEASCICKKRKMKMEAGP